MPIARIRFAGRCLAVGCAMVLAVSVESRSIGQDHSFQSFSRSISPEQLNSILGSSDAVQKKIVSDKVADMVLKKFSNLSAEQKSNLLELAKDFEGGQNSFDFARKKEQFESAIRNDPELRKAAEELRSSMRDQNINLDRSTRRELERDIQREIQDRIQAELERNPNLANPNVLPNQDIDPDIFRNFNQNPSQNRSGNPNSIFNGDPRQNTNQPQNGNPNSNFNPNFSQSEPRSGSNPNSGFNNRRNPNNSDPSEPNSGPFNGFSDNGSSQPQTSPDSPPNTASASGGNDSPPKESVGHRFNRMLMNSMEKAIEKRVGGESESGQGSFDRLMTKFIGSLADSNPNFDTGNSGPGILSRLSSRVQNSTGRSRWSMPRLSGFGSSNRSSGTSFGSGIAMPAFSPRSVLMFLVIVGMVIAAVVFIIRKTPIAQFLGLQPPALGKPAPPQLPSSIEDHQEIVTLVDRLTLWLFGQKADWWNSKIVQQKIAQTSPVESQSVKKVMKIYDQARYSEAEQPISQQASKEVRATLEQIKEFASQKSESQ